MVTLKKQHYRIICFEHTKSDYNINKSFDWSRWDTIEHYKTTEQAFLQQLNCNFSHNKYHNLGFLGVFYNDLRPCCLVSRWFSIEKEKPFSERRKITTGVPQGSVIGPLIFL